LDQQVPLVLEEIVAQEEPQDKQDPLVHLELEEMSVFLDQVARQGHPELLVPREPLVELADLALLAPVVQPVQLAFLDNQVKLDPEETQEQLAHLDSEETLDQLARQDLRVLKDRQDL